MPKLPDIADCPWCGSQCVKSGVIAPVYVECNGGACNVIGPERNTPLEAIEAWNTVASQQKNFRAIERALSCHPAVGVSALGRPEVSQYGESGNEFRSIPELSQRGVVRSIEDTYLEAAIKLGEQLLKQDAEGKE